MVNHQSQLRVPPTPRTARRPRAEEREDQARVLERRGLAGAGRADDHVPGERVERRRRRRFLPPSFEVLSAAMPRCTCFCSSWISARRSGRALSACWAPCAAIAFSIRIRLNIPRMFAALLLISVTGIAIFVTLQRVLASVAASLARQRADPRDVSSAFAIAKMRRYVLGAAHVLRAHAPSVVAPADREGFARSTC